MALRFVFNPFTHQFDAVTPLPAYIGFLTGDAGGPVGPDAGNNINLIGGTGLTVTGTPLTNTLSIAIDGILDGSGQTIGAANTNLITLPLGAVAGVYDITVNIVGYDLTNPAGIGIEELATVRTTGAVATVVDNVDTDLNSEAPIVPVLTYSRVAGNNFIVTAYGTAGQTINWYAKLTYIKVV